MCINDDELRCLNSHYPWIGEHYCNNNNVFGLRLLVVAESHFDDGIDNQDQQFNLPHGFTRYVVENYAMAPNIFFTTLSNLLRERDGGPWEQENGEIWNHVAFYNYIQGFVGYDNGALPPNRQQWKESKEAFDTVIKVLQPNAVVICSYQTWDWINCVYQHPNDSEMYLPYLFGNICWLGLNHPRGGINFANAIPAFQTMLECGRIIVQARQILAQ